MVHHDICSDVVGNDLASGAGQAEVYGVIKMVIYSLHMSCFQVPRMALWLPKLAGHKHVP